MAGHKLGDGGGGLGSLMKDPAGKSESPNTATVSDPGEHDKPVSSNVLRKGVLTVFTLFLAGFSGSQSGPTSLTSV